MINLIAFCDSFTEIDWYFNHSKETFVHMDQADLSEDFWTECVNIPESIFQIALNEFGCSEAFCNKSLSVVVSQF